MKRPLLSVLLTLSVFSAADPLRAQVDPIPPVPAPAPKPGLVNEPFNQIVLSPTPAPGASVPGWYPLSVPVWNGMDTVLEERAPAVFATDQGVLRLRDEFDGYPRGRVRQLPDGTTEVCVDLYFYEERADYVGYGLAANFNEFGYPIYGITVALDQRYSSEPEGAVEELIMDRVYTVNGPGFYEMVEGNLADRWLRLCMKLDATRTVFTAELNGQIIYSGPLKSRRSVAEGEEEPPSEPLPFFTDVAIVQGYGAVVSEPEPSGAVEESQILTEAFFDNFSHNGASNSADLTVGPTRATATKTGAGVIGRDSAQQAIVVDARYNAKATAFFGLANGGGGSGDFSLRGGIAGASKVGVVSHLYQGGRKSNITAGLRSGTAGATLSGGEKVLVSSEATLKPAFRAIMSRLRGRYLQGRQSLFVSSGGSVVDAASATFRFESAIPAVRRDR